MRCPEYAPLIEAASDLLAACLEAQPPGQYAADLCLSDGFMRLLSMMKEHCEAIGLLCQEDYYRPAHSLLRGLLELSATLAWIDANPVPHASRFLTDDMPSISKRMRVAGWSSEYERSYRYLCGRTHPSADGALDYHEIALGSPNEPCPEIGPDTAIFVVQDMGSGAVGTIAEIPRDAEAVRRAHMPRIGIKTLDFVACALAVVYGPTIERQRFWDASSIAMMEHRYRKLRDPEFLLLWKKVRRKAISGGNG